MLYRRRPIFVEAENHGNRGWLLTHKDGTKEYVDDEVFTKQYVKHKATHKHGDQAQRNEEIRKVYMDLYNNPILLADDIIDGLKRRFELSRDRLYVITQGLPRRGQASTWRKDDKPITGKIGDAP